MKELDDIPPEVKKAPVMDCYLIINKNVFCLQEIESWSMTKAF